jgi:hypothetical protein
MPTQQEPMPTVMATADLINTAEDESLGEVTRADLAIQFGLIPVLLFLGGTLIFWIRYKNKP